jgi:4-oxalocrotonate tautomerase
VTTMPIIDVSLVAGRSAAELRGLVTAVHEAVVTSLGVPGESVRVLVRELPPTHWAANDETIAERRAR